MADKKTVFVAFAIEDEAQRNLLKGQALNTKSPFEYIEDPSRVLCKLASWRNQPTEQLTTLRPYATFCHSLAKNEGNCLCPSILRS